MSFKKILAAGIVAVTMATGASAATFDFATLADQAKVANGNIEATFDQSQPGGWTVDGITVDVTSYNFDTFVSHAFLDAGNAGLGVCSSGFDANGNSNCATGGLGSDQGDDNVTDDEGLDLVFSETVNIIDMLFRNATHGLANGTIFAGSASLGGLFSYDVVDGKLSDSDLASLGANSVFGFDYDNDGPNRTQFYVSSITISAVPLPASMAFLLVGLGGLGALKRHRKAA